MEKDLQPQKTKKLENKIEFDPNFSLNNPHNREVARQKGVRYNPRSRCYEDEDGCLIYDRFGQSF